LRRISEHTTNLDSSVYYTGRYWNDLPQVRDYLQRRATGTVGTRWFEHLRGHTGRERFERALVLNCGNGWVERELAQRGVVAEAVGIDIAPDLLAQADAQARAEALPLRYVECDANGADFPEGPYDLVVNYSAAHHVAYLNRVFRRICELLPADGVFVSWDYVGPHRNQYPSETWRAAHALNDRLPERFRADMGYPHLPTMLATDPTEAIHSELIVEVLHRYFRVDWFAPLGGALAYPLLCFNDGIHDAPPAERDPWIERVVAADDAYTEAHPETTLFAFAIARPDKSALDDAGALARWSDEEERREAAAARNGGLYAGTAGAG
jgi:SAM-dependent methyltransferase